ncbi:MAG: Tim44 domain-containing protein [Desulfocapsaceae bacterium]|nr:Tim44 domain-containing protein [Desulfocapsaceae bacterium]
MSSFFIRLTPFFLVLLALLFTEAGISTDFADARSRSGGRSFSRSTPAQKAPATNQAAPGSQAPKSGFGSGLAGGLLGGALGGMLFGSMFGMGGGSGMGILPLLLLGGIGYFVYKRFIKPPTSGQGQVYQPPTNPLASLFSGNQPGGLDATVPPPPPPTGAFPGTLDEGLGMIRQTDPGFDANYFVEVASDVFFKVQAGWMRRDIASYRHLLGDGLAAEYERQFADMRQLGRINKLESISIRKVEIVSAGKENGEDFVTVLFTANLLDYTVDEHSGAVVEGSMTDPVKFAEEWTWARPSGTEAWKLEGLKVVNG